MGPKAATKGKAVKAVKPAKAAKPVKPAKPKGKHPFPFFAHGPTEPGGDLHLWVVRFAKPVPSKRRVAIARLLLEPLRSSVCQQSDEHPWRWDEEWLVLTAVDAPASPGDGLERFEAMVALDRALIAVHAIAPIAEVVNGHDGGGLTGSAWDVWSRDGGAAPSKPALQRIRRGGKADAEVEALRLSDAPLEDDAGGGGGLSLVEVDKRSAPQRPVLEPSLAEHLAAMEKADKRGDRVVCVMDTPAGQVLYARAANAAYFELSLSRNGRCHSVRAPSATLVDHQRGRVDGTPEGVFLAADTRGRRIFELAPEAGTRRVVFHGHAVARGPWEVCRLGERVVLSTTEGLTLLAWSGDELTAVAFAALRGFKHMTRLPNGDGVLVCTFGEGESEIRVASVFGDRLAFGPPLAVKPAVLEPVVDGPRILVRQGRSLREVRGARRPPAPPPPVEIRLEVAKTPGRRRRHAGHPVVDARPVAGGEVLIVDEIDRHAIVLVRGGGVRDVALPKEARFPLLLDVSADGERVLLGGQRSGGSPLGEVLVSEGRFRPAKWLWNNEVSTACYLAEDRLLMAFGPSLMVITTSGTRVSNVPAFPDSATTLVAARPNGALRVLVRTANGRAVRLKIDGDAIVPTDLGLEVAEIFTDGTDLFATCDGVTYRVDGAGP